MILLTLDIVSRVVFTQQEAVAKSSVQYMLADDPRAKGGGSKDAYEKLLNDMANQGWEYDHYWYQYMVFKK